MGQQSTRIDVMLVLEVITLWRQRWLVNLYVISVSVIVVGSIDYSALIQ